MLLNKKCDLLLLLIFDANLTVLLWNSLMQHIHHPNLVPNSTIGLRITARKEHNLNKSFHSSVTVNLIIYIKE